MLFNSISYVVFLPLCVTLYFLTPLRVRNVFLLFASYFFYMCWMPRYALLLLFSTLVTWLCGFLVERMERQMLRSLALSVNIAVNLGILFLFKYYNFFVDILARVFPAASVSISLPASSLLLPVGISFYTFQALGYSIDVYRGDIRHERNFINYALFVSFFPQLVAGPIERSANLLPQFREEHHFDPDRAVDGLRLILLGLFKKIVIADMAALYVDAVFMSLMQYSDITVAASVILFAVQIYCDFSGYSDIARGSAALFGFRLMKNFNAPYFSTSITEFWTRWHISLSTWFRDYLYIPLGGNRKGFARKCANLMIVFLVSGLWHGASLSFVVWGGLHGLYRLTEEAYRKCAEPLRFRYAWCYRVWSILKGVACFALVCFAWIFFRAESVMTGIYAAKSVLRAPLLLSDSAIILSELNSILANNYFYTETFRAFFLFTVVEGVIVLVCENSLRKEPAAVQVLGKPCLRWIAYWTTAMQILFCFLLENGIYGQSGQFIYFQF